MLTTSIKGRAFDFSRIVGGRQFRGIIYVALGSEDDIYVVLRDSNGPDILKISVGTEPEDVEVLISFKDVEKNNFVNSWPSCATLINNHVFVTDELKNVVSVFDTNGNLIESIGKEGTKPKEFLRPSGITSDSKGNLYISDTLNHRIQQITTNGDFIRSWGELGSNLNQFNSPWGLCLTNNETLLVCDHKNHRIQEFNTDGVLVSSFGEFGTSLKQLNHPSDISIDPDGDIYVADWANNRVQIFDRSGNHLTELKGSAIELSKWQRTYINASPDVYKARRRVPSLEPETYFALPISVTFDQTKSRLLAVDSQRWRIQIFNKISNYTDPQFNI